MKRGYAIKEKSKGKRLKWSREKTKEMNPKEKYQESVLVQNATTILFFAKKISLCAIS